MLLKKGKGMSDKDNIILIKFYLSLISLLSNITIATFSCLLKNWQGYFLSVLNRDMADFFQKVSCTDHVTQHDEELHICFRVLCYVCVKKL